MDSLITAAALALAKGDPLGALNRVALRQDAAALALRGIAMAQLGDYQRARALLKAAARAFGQREALARARCILAEAEIALVSRDLAWPEKALEAARLALEARGDQTNAAHARLLEIRRLVLIGRLDDAERLLGSLDPGRLPVSLRASHQLVAGVLHIRRLRTGPAGQALKEALIAARTAGNAALAAEIDIAGRALRVTAARLISGGAERALLLAEVEALATSNLLIIDACRHVARQGDTTLSLAGRPVLFALARTLAEAWPADASREVLLKRAFRARHADESHRARLRVEIGRLRAELRGLADVEATKDGFVLVPTGAAGIEVLAPPVDEPHGEVLALMADGEAWSSSALAIALSTSPRTIQRALDRLAEAGKVWPIGRGPARRWMTPPVTGFPTSLLLPGPLPGS